MNRIIGRPIIGSLLLFVSTLAIYAPAMSGELIWDDQYLVGQNPFFRSPIFVLEVFRHYLFVNSPSEYYRPVQNCSYIFDYLIWRGNPFGYHLTNILIHGFSAVLLHRLLRHLLPQLADGCGKMEKSFVEGAALLVALFWVIHPIHNAAVAYIAGRADSLASLFALSAWLVWLNAKSVGGLGRVVMLVTGATLALLALCSKEIALLWVVLFALHLLLFANGRSWRDRCLTLCALACIVGVYALLRSLPASGLKALDPTLPLTDRFLLMFRALGDYAGLIFFPDRLTMDRTLSTLAPVTFFGVPVGLLRSQALLIGGVATLLGCLALSFRRFPGRKVRIAGAAWFFIGFLPVSNLFPLNAEVAEHWIYLPSIGFLLFLSGCLTQFPTRFRLVWPAVVAAALLAFGIRTAVRAADWVDRITFYTRTINAGGGTPRIHSNLALEFGNRGDFATQERILRRTLALFPEYLTSRIQLGSCLMKQGRKAEAEELLSQAKPAAEQAGHRFADTWSAALNLARMRNEAKQPEAALEILSQARPRFPGVWPLIEAEAEILEKTRGPAAALPIVQRYAEARWWHMDSRLALGRLFLANEEFDAAIGAMQHASRLDIYDPRPLANIARIELGRNRLEAALIAQEAAIHRDSAQPSRYHMLAGILSSLGRPKEAALAMQRAATLRASVLAE